MRGARERERERGNKTSGVRLVGERGRRVQGADRRGVHGRIGGVRVRSVCVEGGRGGMIYIDLH